MKHNLTKTCAAAFMAVMAMASMPQADACTRVLYKGDENLLIVGRSLDWKTPIPTNVYVYPAGMEKQGNVQENAVRWTSKYGAVYAVSYDGGVTEGMNEKGLVVNGLFCKGTVYSNETTLDRAPMSLAMFPAWLLDMNATVDECVEVLKKHEFNISGATFDGGTVSALHWGITDATGKTAILEFDNGNVKIYEGDDIRTLTNDPQWPAMQAINDYWKKKGGEHTLPGTVSSPDRYVRADFFIHNVGTTGDADLGATICRTVMMNASVPYQYTPEGDPNVSSTQWRSFSNIRDKRYYFEQVTNSGFWYIDLNKCNLKPGASVMKLFVNESGAYTGEANKYLKKVKPFTPMY
ncbi:MAG: linear amide C-N hydrolase [Prevotella sp.]|nr:linear amide C-N hydrolase [Prevotella sp.]MCM1074136.1 linear amide C-N hydrolase [Ruminococcus sp.]